MKPLTGVTVLEFCHSVAGPYAGLVLATLGANVIKIENPRGGDHARSWGPPYWQGTSSIFQCLNVNKRSVAADLENPDHAAQIRKFIVDKADVVIQNLRPGSIAKYGLAGPDLLKEKPSLIYCNLGAFGAVGPLSAKPGYDPLMQAFGGIMSVTGEAGREPVRVGPAVVDLGSGMWSVIGILAALQHRNVAGKGCNVDTSLFETALAWMTVQISSFLTSGIERKPMGSGTAEIVPHQAFKTSDGYIMVAAGNDGLFGKFCAALGIPDWAGLSKFSTNDGRVQNRSELIPGLQRIIGEKTTEEWRECLDRFEVPNAPIQSIQEVLKNEQTKALGMLQEIPEKNTRVVSVPLTFDGVRNRIEMRAPALGEHTAEIITTSIGTGA